MKLTWAVAGLVLGALTLPSQAARPLLSDDAGTADAGTCQVEMWSDRVGSDRAVVVAPACGVAPGLEIGIDRSWTHRLGGSQAAAGLALKWAPAALSFDTAAGALSLGLKINGAWSQPTGGSWRSTTAGLLGLATVKAGESFHLHSNLGLAQDRASGTHATLLNLGLAWLPGQALLLFAEVQTNSRRDVFGGRVNALGGRWWLLPDKLGLDLSASRESGAGKPTRWSLGLGWYGIGS